jgi:23S rRNA pseudouridine1911/1915/1917 synthase
VGLGEVQGGARRFVVESEQAGVRLDQFLAAALAPEHSRSQISRMIKAGRVTINERPAKAATALRRGDRIVIEEAPPSAPIAIPESAPEIEVVYQDAEMIVVNKPAGMTVHQAPGHPHATLVDALLVRFPELAAMAEPDGLMRPGIVHRLDKDTSGAMVVARTPFARTAIARQFKERTVRKLYVAIVCGVIGRDAIRIERPVGRHPTERKRMSIRSRNPREAISQVTVLHRLGDATLVGVRPETGRTHQIRVHLASIGHGCLGDALYGQGGARGEGSMARQALHAYALAVDHPRSGRRMEFRAPLAGDMADYLCENGLATAGEVIERWVEREGSADRRNR